MTPGQIDPTELILNTMEAHRKEAVDRHEALRIELRESFVLKAVFDVWGSDVLRRLGDVEMARNTRLRDYLSYVGAGLGVLSILNSWFHFLR